MSTYDTQPTPRVQEKRPCPEHIQQELQEYFQPQQAVQAAARGKRGAPCKISQGHLWMSLLWCVLQGMSNFQDWHRLVVSQRVGQFAPVSLTDDALIKRLEQAGAPATRELFVQVSTWLKQRFGHLWSTTLAPFAQEIIAIDECTLDQLQRHLKVLRSYGKGEAELLAGKLVGFFDVRRQQWWQVCWYAVPPTQGPQLALPWIQQLPRACLLLFDLGYFSFAWFDYLCERGYWYVCRLREGVSYEIQHVYYQQGEILDALVWLGTGKQRRAGYLARLVRFEVNGKSWSYVSNVLDPVQLPLADIAQLYARRWDIELAFLTIKEFLGLHHWWSGKLVHIEQQLWLILTVAQVYQALRMQLAYELQVDPFALSVAVLIKEVPVLLREQREPVAWLREQAATIGLLRPSRRFHVQAPVVPTHELVWPSEPLAPKRAARYRVDHPKTKRPSGAACRKRKRERERAREGEQEREQVSCPPAVICL